MGCDIHTHVEYLRTVNGNKEWIDGNFYKRNPYFEKGKDDGEQELEIVHPYSDRNYTLFSILADVRNYGNNKPICEPKGLPIDCCKEIREESERWGCDGHSHSWFTLEELYNAQSKFQKVKHRGMISPQAQENLKKGITPDEWCQGTNQADWKFAEWEENVDILDKLIKSIEKRAEHFLWAWNKEQLLKIANDIRVVFWFDN